MNDFDEILSQDIKWKWTLRPRPHVIGPPFCREVYASGSRTADVDFSSATQNDICSPNVSFILVIDIFVNLHFSNLLQEGILIRIGSYHCHKTSWQFWISDNINILFEQVFRESILVRIGRYHCHKTSWKVWVYDNYNILFEQVVVDTKLLSARGNKKENNWLVRILWG